MNIEGILSFLLLFAASTKRPLYYIYNLKHQGAIDILKIVIFKGF